MVVICRDLLVKSRRFVLLEESAQGGRRNFVGRLLGMRSSETLGFSKFISFCITVNTNVGRDPLQIESLVGVASVLEIRVNNRRWVNFAKSWSLKALHSTQ